MSRDNDHNVFNRDKFIRALYAALKDEALAYKAKKESTSNDSLIIGTKPLMYDFFVPTE